MVWLSILSNEELNRDDMFSLSPFAPEKKLVSRDGFGCPVPRHLSFSFCFAYCRRSQPGVRRRRVISTQGSSSKNEYIILGESETFVSQLRVAVRG